MGIFSSIKNAVSSAVDKVKSSVSSAASNAASKVSQAVENKVSLFDNITSDISTAASNIVSDIKEADNPVSLFSSIGSDIKTAVSDSVSDYADYFESEKSLAADIASDISSAAGNVINKLTDDGEDDGKISFGTAAVNLLKGVGKTVVNGVKGMFTDSEGNFSIGKTILSVGTIAACVACPAVGAVLGAVGVVAGGIQLGKGVYNAVTADTDEEAKEAWQNIGGGTFTAVLSAVGTKASLSAMKSASTAGLNGGSAMDEATTASGKISGFFKDAASSTKNNVSSIASKVKTAVKSADDSSNTTAKTAFENADDAASAQKAATESLENTPESQLDAYDKYYLEKAKNGTLTEEDVTAWYQKEYCKLRGVDNNKICENSALQDVIDNPNVSDVETWEFQNGYWKARSSTGSSFPEVYDRASLNVTNDPNLITELDTLMSTGTYTIDGKTYVCENMVDFMYKTASDSSQWFTREDPISIYFKGEVNSSTVEAIANITAKYSNGSLHNATGSLVDWFAVEQAPNSSMISGLKSSALFTNSSIYNSIVNHSSNWSAGEYESFWNILNMIKNAA